MINETTLGEIVRNNFRTAAVLENYGLDFCCGGKKTLVQGCSEKGIDTKKVLEDLSRLQADESSSEDFNAWGLDFLVDYIVHQHHDYVKKVLPIIQKHLAKCVAAHGEKHHELLKIAEQFDQIAAHMTSHMKKEEEILFPYVKLMWSTRLSKFPVNAPFGAVENPIRVMEIEHEEAGDAIRQIRHLSHGFLAPADSCTTFKLCYAELEDFERDLHRHVHLENNILFPKAIELEQTKADASHV